MGCALSLFLVRWLRERPILPENGASMAHGGWAAIPFRGRRLNWSRAVLRCTPALMELLRATALEFPVGDVAGATVGRRVDERRDAHPFGHRARRPPGGRTVAAAGLRRVAKTRGRADGRGETRAHLERHCPGPRGVPAPGRRPALRRPRPLLRRR